MNKKTINVLIPGFSDSPIHYKKLINILKKNNIKVKIIDFSKMKKIEKSYLKWVFQELDKIKNKKINLIGFSMGGGIATIYTSKHPKKIKKLILIDPLLEKVNYYKRAKRIIQELKNSKLNLKEYLKKKRKKEKTQRFILKEIKLISEMNKLWKEKFNIIGQTILLWGEKDNLTPLSSLGKSQINFLNKKLTIIPKRHHFIENNLKFANNYLIPALNLKTI